MANISFGHNKKWHSISFLTTNYTMRCGYYFTKCHIAQL